MLANNGLDVKQCEAKTRSLVQKGKKNQISVVTIVLNEFDPASNNWIVDCRGHVPGSMMQAAYRYSYIMLGHVIAFSLSQGPLQP